MKKRALFAFLASISTAACLACGCGGGSSGSVIILDGVEKTQTTSLTVFGNRADRYSLSVFEDTLQKFMSENPVIATYEGAAEGYWQALERRFDTDNLDDIFFIERDRLLTMTEKGALADLSDIVDEKKFNDFARSQLYSADGNIYAVPTAISTYGLYVNYDLLEDNGFKAPANFNEFEEICEYFKPGITPIICNDYSSISSLILAAGTYDIYCGADTAGEIEKINSNPAYLSEHLKAGIDFVYLMKENGWIVTDDALQTGQSKELEKFATGNYPFMITGGWLSDTLEEKFDLSFDYFIYPYPIPEKDSVLVAKADLVSVKKGTNEDGAKELVSLLTSSDTLLLLNDHQSRFTPLNINSIDASDPIKQSTTSLFKGKFVVSGDIRLTLPLDGYLEKCASLILGGNSAESVKAYLDGLLSGGSADE